MVYIFKLLHISNKPNDPLKQFRYDHGNFGETQIKIWRSL
jgi:hypothetical protein